MKIIIPMAGMGKRMRPHTLTVPKPLLPVAGKAIVQKLAEDITRVCNEQPEEIAFIIGPTFGKEVEKMLIDVAGNLNAKGRIFYQEEALGTAHAIMCAKECLDGKLLWHLQTRCSRPTSKWILSKKELFGCKKLKTHVRLV